MNYRLATILARKAISADTVETIDINLKDPVSQFMVTYENTNGAANAASTGFPSAAITKIELIDGSDVLYSLNGREAQAADWYHNKREPVSIVWYMANTTNEVNMLMNFGRFLNDPVLAFDPKKFTNPQLKISIDVSAGGIAGVGGYLTVIAHAFDEKMISPIGFLMHKEIKSYAGAATAHEYTNLPTDYPYRKLFFRCQVYGTGIENLINTFKLSEDQDKRIPINQTMPQILRAITGRTKPYTEWILTYGDTTATRFHCTPTYWPIILATPWSNSAGAAVGLAAYEGDGGRFIRDQYATTYNASFYIKGWCPHGVIEIPFGDPMDIDDWYDVARVGSLELDVLSTSSLSASDSAQIFLQQLRRY